jgi:PAS domain S-box-containing protein
VGRQLQSEPGEVEFELDGEGVIISANQATAEATGYQVEELIGSHYHQLVPAAHAGLVARQFERKRQNPDLETSYEVAIERADGHQQWLAVTSRRIDGPGEPLRVRVTAHVVDEGD